MNGGAIFRAEQSRRNRELATAMEADGLPRDRIARELGLARKTIGKYLGPPRKEQVMSERVDRAEHEKTAPIGALPTVDRTLLHDYERDKSPADAPDVRVWNNRETSAEEQVVMEAALRQARAREASVVSMGRAS